VRLALFQEQRRTPLRLDKTSGSQRGASKVVLHEAQLSAWRLSGCLPALLRTPLRGKTRARTNWDSEWRARANGRWSSGLKRKGSETYILRPTLDPALIERAAQTNKRIFEVEAANAPDEVDGTEPGARIYGSLIAWNSSAQLAALVNLYVILTLILVSGKDMDLRLILRRLRLRPPPEIALPAHTPHRTPTFEPYLTQLQHQGYLDRARGRGDEENDVVWNWSRGRDRRGGRRAVRRCWRGGSG